MKYVAKPVEVEAFTIVSVGKADASMSVDVATDDGVNRIADPGMLARYQPRPGDYWVIQADGYEYLNPKDVFERKYSPLASAQSGGECNAIHENRAE